MIEERDPQLLIELMKTGLGLGRDLPRLKELIDKEPVDWAAIKEMAHQQNILAIVFHGLEKIYTAGFDLGIPDEIYRQWYGNAYKYAEKYEKYTDIIGKLSRFYANGGFKMMVMKGYGLGLEYPTPVYRPYGDIDLWLFGKQKEADEYLTARFRKEVDSTKSIHTTFKASGIVVENHFEFFNSTAHPSNRYINEILLEQATVENCRSVKINDQNIYLPNNYFNSLYLLRHTAQHFVAVEIKLRHFLDWGFFVKRHWNEIDWPWIESQAVRFHMLQFFDMQNAICVYHLGFPRGMFPVIRRNHALENRIMRNIFQPEFTEPHPDKLLKIIGWKWRRWRSGLWRHKIVYSENALVTLIAQTISHLKNPATIKI